MPVIEHGPQGPETKEPAPAPAGPRAIVMPPTVGGRVRQQPDRIEPKTRPETAGGSAGSDKPEIRHLERRK